VTGAASSRTRLSGGRRTLLTITGAGRGVADLAHESPPDGLEAALGGLDDSEREALARAVLVLRDLGARLSRQPMVVPA
jgi:DNA-binding MarR family transcriptional regulator